MTAEQERTFVVLAQLFPVIVWIWKRRESPVVDAHAKEARNFGITALICIGPRVSWRPSTVSPSRVSSALVL